MSQNLDITVERVRFYNEESGWTIMSARRADGQSTLFGSSPSVVGVFSPEPQPDETLTVEGEWEESKYGTQFKVTRIHDRKPPTTEEGFAAYLSSGMFEGIGSVTAYRIIDEFGGVDGAMDVLENNPSRLAEVKRISDEMAQRIGEQWKKAKESREALTYLCGLGLTMNMALRIYDRYEARTIEAIQENPYRLAHDVDGIGFKRADTIARKALQFTDDSPYRLEAGIVYALKEAQGNGHVFLPRSDLLTDAAALLDRPKGDPAVRDVLDRMISDQALIIVEGDNIYLPHLHRAEGETAQLLRRLLSEKRTDEIEGDIAALIRSAESSMGITLTAEQRGGVRQALTSKVSIVTGGPGTGKSSILRAVVRVLSEERIPFALAAPTGMAAKRLKEAAGEAASTIHRLLEYQPPGGFARGRHNMLDASVIIIDEVSMVDITLMFHLVQAIKPSASLLLVGDKDQLPSVGPGNVLNDLIACGEIPVTRLTKIFRQSEGSLISVNAHHINNGRMPELPAPEENNPGAQFSEDFFFWGADDQDRLADAIVSTVVDKLPAKFGYDPLRDVMVLAPMYKGKAGIDVLNRRLQHILNPPRPGKIEWQSPKSKLVYRTGDKIMQTKNDYDLEIFNGDIGYIESIDLDGKDMAVRFDDRLVTIEFAKLAHLRTAYCVSVHKSQGSEYPAVVMAVHSAHYIMLQRNLVYTGITRGKRTVVLVGQRQAIQIAVSNNRVAKRYTALADRLKMPVTESPRAAVPEAAAMLSA